MRYSLQLNIYARVAQLVEHATDTGGVPGSNPGARTRKTAYGQFSIGARERALRHVRTGFEKSEHIFDTRVLRGRRKCEDCTVPVGKEFWAARTTSLSLRSSFEVLAQYII